MTSGGGLGTGVDFEGEGVAERDVGGMVDEEETGNCVGYRIEV